MSPRRRMHSAIAIAVALVLVLALAHHVIASFALQRALGVLTGYDVRFGGMALGWSHATFTGVHVGKNGDPVLDAARIDVDYALRDVFPGGKHRYGFAGIAIDHPTLTLLRHADGSFNVSAGTSPPAPVQNAVEPLLFSARLRNGTIELVDAAPLEPDLRVQSITGVTIDASVQSNARTVARVDGTFVGRRSRSAPIQRWPISVRSVIDYTRGFAMHDVRAPALPLRGLLNFLVHAPIVRFDDGVMRDVDVRAYAIDFSAGTPLAYRLGGGGRLDGGQIALGPLAKPIRALHGQVDVFDDGVTFEDLRGTAAGVALHVRGGMYDFSALHFRLGIAADAQLAQMRELFAFLRDQPIRGPFHLETLVTATVDRPLIRTVVTSPRLYYDRMPLVDAGGTVDYYDGVVSFAGFHARFGALQTAVGGEIPVDVPNGALEGVLHVSGPASALPYAQTVAAGEEIGGDAIIGGEGTDGFHAHGAIVAAGPHGSGAGFIAVDERGRGEFGPFFFQRDDGSSLAGALRLERPISASAGWAAVNHYRFDVARRVAVLPGVDLPVFPQIGGIVDAAIVAGGSPSDFVVAGHARVLGARYQQYPLGDASVDLGGTFADLRLSDIRLDGASGRFRGAGAVAGGTFAVRGTYDGSLEDLEPFTGDIDAHGAVHAPVLALADGHGVTVQTSGAALRGGSIHGVALGSAAGTMTIAGNAVRIVAASALLDGARAVAAARGSETAVSMVGVPAAAFAGAGIPLDAGHVSVFGLGDFGRPAFRGSIDLDGGAALGYPVGGSVDVVLDGRNLRISDGIASLGGTYAQLAGNIDDLGDPNFHYDIAAGVSLGDVGGLVTDLRLPLRYAAGSFAAQVRVTGGAGAPSLQGIVSAPEGSYNGLAFRDAGGRVAVGGGGLSVAGGRVTIGTTRAAFRASIGGGSLSLAASSPAVDLADFDSYFDEGDTLAGTGSLDFALSSTGRGVTTSGRVALTGTRIRRFPLGGVAGSWSTSGGRIVAGLNVAGPGGTLRTSGTVVPAAGGLLAALRGARYDGDVQAAGVDLGTFLPALGLTYPILGHVAASEHIAGVFPRLAIGGQAALEGGQVGPFPVSSAEATTRIVGDRVVIDAADADIGFARFTAGGTVGLGAGGPLALRVHASVPDLTLAARRAFPHRALDVAGSLEADALIGGTYAKPQVTAGFDLEQPRYGQVLVQRVIGSAQTDLHSLVLDSADIILNHGSAIVAGSLPIVLRPAGIGPPDAPLSITADARGVELSALSPLLPGSGTKLTGTVDGHVALDGTVRSPRVLGTVSFSNGSYVSNIETSPIRNAAAQLVFEGTSVALEAFHANLGSGSLDADGKLNLPIAGTPFQGYAINVTVKGAQVNVPAFGGGTIDGTAQILGGARLPTLSGDLAVSNATIPFATVFRASGPAEIPGTGPVFDLGFNLKVDARNVRIKSPVIDVGAAGSILLTGTLRSPRAAGEFTATRGGVFSTYQTLFRIQDATVTFDPAAGIVPDLDLRATAHVENPDPDPSRNAIGDADINVAVTGPADDYRIAYSSDPPYSQAQIIALLVDLPVLGSLSFPAQLAGNLRGAPGETDVLLPPGVTLYETGTTPIQQEAFSLLNTQLTQRLVSPLENAFGGAVGLTDLELTLGYGGRVGYTARQRLSRKRQIFASFGQVLTYPTRTQIGFQARPDAATTMNFSYFQQNGTPYYSNSIFGNTNTVQISNGVQPLSGRQGFTFVLTRTYP